MSMIEPIRTMAEPWDNLDARHRRGSWRRRRATPIVPRRLDCRTIADRRRRHHDLPRRADGRSGDDGGERRRTTGSRPSAARSPSRSGRCPAVTSKRTLPQAVAIARATAGIADVRAYTKEESAQLVEPWLGSGLALDELPIPRLIVVKLVAGAPPDFAATALGACRARTEREPRRSPRLDGSHARHGGSRGRRPALPMLALVVVVTVLSVTFATRGAMATNRPIVEVLHYVGATDGFVASQFQRHFLMLGFKGGAIGGGAALLLFGILAAASAWLAGTRRWRRGGGFVRQLFRSAPPAIWPSSR